MCVNLDVGAQLGHVVDDEVVCLGQSGDGGVDDCCSTASQHRRCHVGDDLVDQVGREEGPGQLRSVLQPDTCLLYTSDAADE